MMHLKNADKFMKVQKMTSKEIVDRYKAKLKGQKMLWEDCDFILKKTRFKKIDPEFDRQALVHWWMYVYGPEDYGPETTPFEVFNTWSNAMYPNFKYVNVSGYVPATKQSCVQFSGYRHDPIQSQVEDLEMWLPHVKPNKKGYKFIDVFEYTASAHGIFFLEFYPKSIHLNKTTYGTTATLKKFKTVAETVEYVVEHHPYEGNEEEDE